MARPGPGAVKRRPYHFAVQLGHFVPPPAKAEDKTSPQELFRADLPATVPVLAIGQVDTPAFSPHFCPVSKKPSKVQETTAPYTAKQAAKAVPASTPGVRYADPVQAKKSMDKVFSVHKELLRKLAQ